MFEGSLSEEVTLEKRPGGSEGVREFPDSTKLWGGNVLGGEVGRRPVWMEQEKQGDKEVRLERYPGVR